MSELMDYLQTEREELQQHLQDGDLEDYINDSALEIEVTCTLDRKYRGCLVTLTFGGPNIFLNTRTGVLEGYWGSEQRDLPVDSAITNQIDSFVEEIFDSY